ncbi:MAG: hypothetical protein ACK50P_23920 [Planctomycetaceae bacterium]
MATLFTMSSLTSTLPHFIALLCLTLLLGTAVLREGIQLYNYLDQFALNSRYIPAPPRLRALLMALPIILVGVVLPVSASLLLNRRADPPIRGAHMLICILLAFPFTLISAVLVLHRFLPASLFRSLKVAGCLFGLLIPVLGSVWLVIKLFSRALEILGRI